MIDGNEMYEVRVMKKLKDLTTNELYDICETEHASCNRCCPVYDCKTLEEQNSGDCDCFKNGKKMYDFIHKQLKVKD